jgi:hypothetical protein
MEIFLFSKEAAFQNGNGRAAMRNGGLLIF